MIIHYLIRYWILLFNIPHWCRLHSAIWLDANKYSYDWKTKEIAIDYLIMISLVLRINTAINIQPFFVEKFNLLDTVW